MKIQRIEVENYLKNKLTQAAFNPEEAKRIYTELEEKYDVPTGVAMDWISGRTDLSSVSPMVLYELTSVTSTYNRLMAYFTAFEIETFSKAKYEDKKKIKFPLHIKCLQVSDDQWICATDSSFLVGLFRQQIINYNENTQRVMRRIVRGETVSYKIELNKKAVKEIRAAYQSGNYIANTITLNIPEDGEADFFYDPQEGELVIKSLKKFDIIDGYHRLIAMSQTMNADEEFNYPMELRIVTFSEEKARQFIYQEDQKTKMTKVASASMNMGSDSNFIVEKLNSSMDSNLKGLINRNEGIVNFADFSAIITRVFYMGKQGTEDKSYRLTLAKDLKEKFNLVTDENPEVLSTPITTKRIYGLVVLFSMSNNPKEILRKANKILFEEDINKIDIKTLSSAKGLKQITDYIQNI